MNTIIAAANLTLGEFIIFIVVFAVTAIAATVSGMKEANEKMEMEKKLR